MTNNIKKKNISVNFQKALRARLLCSFGWAEVETVIEDRCLEAVEKGSMEPLMQPIDLDWVEASCKMTTEAVVERLKKTGLWQLVESEISYNTNYRVL